MNHSDNNDRGDLMKLEPQAAVGSRQLIARLPFAAVSIVCTQGGFQQQLQLM